MLQVDSNEINLCQFGSEFLYLCFHVDCEGVYHRYLDWIRILICPVTVLLWFTVITLAIDICRDILSFIDPFLTSRRGPTAISKFLSMPDPIKLLKLNSYPKAYNIDIDQSFWVWYLIKAIRFCYLYNNLYLMGKVLWFLKNIFDSTEYIKMVPTENIYS